MRVSGGGLVCPRLPLLFLRMGLSALQLAHLQHLQITCRLLRPQPLALLYPPRHTSAVHHQRPFCCASTVQAFVQDGRSGQHTPDALLRCPQHRRCPFPHLPQRSPLHLSSPPSSQRACRSSGRVLLHLGHANKSSSLHLIRGSDICLSALRDKVTGRSPRSPPQQASSLYRLGDQHCPCRLSLFPAPARTSRRPFIPPTRIRTHPSVCRSPRPSNPLLQYHDIHQRRR